MFNYGTNGFFSFDDDYDDDGNGDDDYWLILKHFVL